ncbi:DNA replication/repair protein RecF [Rhodobacteraceae bacterium CCMM004]|nr:DNA replication/repair protein RecF [Rhodobacteraceae bacterium CCMM004]
MHLTSLALSHFRSHKAVRLTLDGRPVAIHGPNGSGKTNLLEAVSLLSPGRGLRRAAADDLARRPETLGWRVVADLAGAGAAHEIELRAEPGASRAVRIDGKAAAQVALGRLVPMLWLVPAMDRLWIEGAEGRRRFLDRMTLSFVPDHGAATLAYERAMRERNRLLRDEVRDPAWYRALERQMAEAGAAIDAGRAEAVARVAAAQDAGGAAFPAADLEIVAGGGSRGSGPADLAVALAEGRGRDLAAGRTLTGPHRDDLAAAYRAKGMAAAQCSTGEQKALLISLILANARALGGAPILLLDEVSAHLDPDRRTALYDAICGLGVQAFLTGTEAALFAGLEGRAEMLAVSEGPDGSSIGAG